MEKEFIGKTENWEEVYEKAKELLKEGKINGIDFVSQEYWEKHQNIRTIHFISTERIELLEKDYSYSKMLFEESKKFELFILTNNFGPEFYYTLLAIVCYK